MDGKKWQEQGVAHYQAGAYAEAIDAFVNARAAYEKASEQGSAAEMLNNQGVVYRMLGEWEKAEAAFTQAQALFAHLGDSRRQAQATANLGMLAAAREANAMVTVARGWEGLFDERRTNGGPGENSYQDIDEEADRRQAATFTVAPLGGLGQ